MWAQRFANKGDTLGRIIAQVYQERDARCMSAPSSTARAPLLGAVPEPSRPAAPGGKMAQSLRDGTVVQELAEWPVPGSAGEILR